MHALAVFAWPALEGAGAGAAITGFGGGAAGAGAAAGVVAPLLRHSATYAFSVIPLAWKPALSALHSSVQALAVAASPQDWDGSEKKPKTAKHKMTASCLFIFHLPKGGRLF